MFDIYCSRCGEAWEQDYLHEPDELGGPENLTYEQAAYVFRVNGCGLFQSEPSPCKRSPVQADEKLLAIKAGQSLSEHPDEWACFI